MNTIKGEGRKDVPKICKPVLNVLAMCVTVISVEKHIYLPYKIKTPMDKHPPEKTVKL